jgi:zinc transporter 5/7
MKDKLHFLTLELSKSNLYFIIGAYVTLFLIKDTLRNVDRLNVESNIFTVLITAITSGAVLIWQSEKLHLSMILVTIGCVCVLNISKSDMTAVGFKRGSVTIMSVISIVLEILALNSDYTGSYLLTIFEFALTAITLIIEVDEDLFKIEHSMEPNVNIIQQLYLHEDTRAIFSFLLLNASFMLVQFLYSFRSKSLGLLSDSLHMALDCTSLALGLVAGVLAKKPPSESFPFGLSKIETLAGFANGVLLIGIVAGIVIEAIERIITPVSLEKTGELLIVSFLGFVVNIVGIFAFNHGHDHGHGGHSHAHSHSHSSSESSNENMHGIFLHILADTLGSAGVVVSTLLTSFFHSNIFDPIASLFIAIMIFVSAIPLVRSSARNLLLNLDDKKDEQIRDILSQIVTTPGIVGYSTPRFWNSPDIAISSSFNQGKSHSVDHKHQDEAHSHSHEHTHEHQPTHEHEHTHECEHSHSHELTHELEHSHTESECKGKTFSMVGFIHIQYLNGENSTIIKKRVQKIFENNNINAVIQVENENSSCWCRAASTS